MIKKKCKECGTLIDPHSQEYCEICHGNYGWWYTCDKHQDIIFRNEVKECPVCRAEAAQPEPTTAKVEVSRISIHAGGKFQSKQQLINEKRAQQLINEKRALYEKQEAAQTTKIDKEPSVKCQCDHCFELIVFKAKDQGSSVSCPYCKLKTKLEVKEQSELTAVTDKIVTEKSNIELVDKSGELLSVKIKTEIGRGALSRFGEDSQFLTDLQFTLDRKGVDWIVTPNQKSTNDTLLNGKTITSVATLKDGDELGVGSEAKKINKLPLKVRIKRLS